MNIADLLISLKVDMGNADSQFKGLRESLKNIGEESKKSHEHLQNFGRSGSGGGGLFSNLVAGAEEFGESILKLGVGLFSVQSVAETLHKGMEELWNTMKESVNVAAELETAHVAFEAFLGSAKEANELVEGLERLAKNEALKFPEIVPAAQHLLALGFSADEATKALKAAGDASWGLGSPLESMSQRMGQLALSGTVGARQLKSLGISTKELADVMGVSVGEVSKAFKTLDEDSRLAVLRIAIEMGKMGGIAEKEKDTFTGSLTEMGNSWHELLATLGADLLPFGKMMVDFATSVIEGASALLDMLDPLRKIHRELDAIMVLKNGVPTTPYKLEPQPLKIGATEAPDTRTHPDEKQKPKYDVGNAGAAFVTGTLTVPGTVKPPVDAETAEIQRKAKEGMTPERAKDAAPAALAKIAAAEAANTQLAALDRQRVEAEIAEEHTGQLVRIAALHDPVERQRQTDVESIRMSEEKALRLTDIDVRETARHVTLLKQKSVFELQAKFETGQSEEKAKSNAAESATNTTAAVAKAWADLELKRGKGAADVAKSIAKQAEDIVVAEREAATKSTKFWADFFDYVDKAAEKSQVEVEHVVDKQIPQDLATQHIETNVAQEQRGHAGVTRAQLELDRAFGLQLVVTLKDRITHTKELGDLEAKSLAITRDRIAADLHDTDPTDTAKVAQLTLDLEKARADVKNKEFETETKILELIQKGNLQFQLRQAALRFGESLPGAFGSGIAQGIFSGKGDVGEQLVSELRNVGRQLTSSILTSALHQLGVEILKNTAIQSLLHAILGIHVAATTANAGATAANTGATILNTFAILKHEIASLLHRIWTGQPLPPLPSKTPIDKTEKVQAVEDTQVSTGLTAIQRQLAELRDQMRQEASSTASRDNQWEGKESGLLAQIAACACHTGGSKPHLGGGEGGCGGGDNGSPTQSDGGGTRVSGTYHTNDPFGNYPQRDNTDITENITYGDVIEDPSGGSRDPWGPSPESDYQFAKGGSPPLGKVSLIGEKGPELFIPRERGTIIPNSILGIFNSGLRGFAEGGIPPVGIPSLIGEHGPELFVPTGPGAVLSTAMMTRISNTSVANNSSSMGDVSFHAHGVTNPDAFIREVARKLPSILKTYSPKFSPHAR